MIITTITYPSGNTATQLEPSENYKYVTDGTTYSTLVIIGQNKSYSQWHDTNEEPPTPPEPVDPETQELADVVEDSYEMANSLI